MATVRYKATYSDNQPSRNLVFRNVPKATAVRISELHNSRNDDWLKFILSTIAGVHSEVLWIPEIQTEFDFWMAQ